MIAHEPLHKFPFQLRQKMEESKWARFHLRLPKVLNTYQLHCPTLSYWCFHIVPSVLFFQSKFYALNAHPPKRYVMIRHHDIPLMSVEMSDTFCFITKNITVVTWFLLKKIGQCSIYQKKKELSWCNYFWYDCFWCGGFYRNAALKTWCFFWRSVYIWVKASGGSRAPPPLDPGGGQQARAPSEFWSAFLFSSPVLLSQNAAK